MADEKQSFANHTRWDPGFHFFLMPVALITAGVVIKHTISVPTPMNYWACVAAVAAVYGVLKIRLYALKVQDRVIRLEERLRLAALLPENQRGRISELSTGQLVALRFASDAELPALAERCWNEKLERKVIKQAVKDWRADYHRV